MGFGRRLAARNRRERHARLRRARRLFVASDGRRGQRRHHDRYDRGRLWRGDRRAPSAVHHACLDRSRSVGSRGVCLRSVDRRRLSTIHQHERDAGGDCRQNHSTRNEPRPGRRGQSAGQHQYPVGGRGDESGLKLGRQRVIHRRRQRRRDLCVQRFGECANGAGHGRAAAPCAEAHCFSRTHQRRRDASANRANLLLGLQRRPPFDRDRSKRDRRGQWSAERGGHAFSRGRGLGPQRAASGSARPSALSIAARAR